MANRVFDTLAQWTTLDDAAFDQAHRGNHRRASRPRGSARWRAGCLPPRSRRRAASRCRPSTPSARGCCISFRSRPMSRRASKCSTKARPPQLLDRLTLEVMLEASRTAGRRRSARRWRSPSPRAADITFKEVIAETIRKRDTVDRVGQPRRRRAEGHRRAERARLVSTPDDTLEALEAEYLVGNADPGSRMADAGRGARGQRQGHRERPDRAHCEARAARRRRTGARPIASIFCTDRTDRREKTC